MRSLTDRSTTVSSTLTRIAPPCPTSRDMGRSGGLLRLPLWVGPPSPREEAVILLSAAAWAERATKDDPGKSAPGAGRVFHPLLAPAPHRALAPGGPRRSCAPDPGSPHANSAARGVGTPLRGRTRRLRIRSGASAPEGIRMMVSWRPMASPPRRPMGWILLLAALAQPGWVAAHEFIDHDSQQHHHGIPCEAETPDLAADRTAHEHGHLDDAMLVAARTPQPSELVALPSSSPEPVALDGPLCAAAAEGARARPGPELADPSQPRAPPHA